MSPQKDSKEGVQDIVWHNLIAHLFIYSSVSLLCVSFGLYYNILLQLFVWCPAFAISLYYRIGLPGSLKMKQTRGILIGGLICFTLSRFAITVLCVVHWKFPELAYYPFLVFIAIHLVSFVFVFSPNELLEVKCQDYLDGFGSIFMKIGFLLYLCTNFPVFWLPKPNQAPYVFSLLFTFSSLFITCVVIRADSFLITKIVDEKKEVIGEYRVDQKGKVFPVNQSQIEPELVL